MITRILKDPTVDEAIGTDDERQLRGVDRYGGDAGNESKGRIHQYHLLYMRRSIRQAPEAREPYFGSKQDKRTLEEERCEPSEKEVWPE
jgi:hypothetical protein